MKSINDYINQYKSNYSKSKVVEIDNYHYMYIYLWRPVGQKQKCVGALKKITQVRKEQQRFQNKIKFCGKKKL